MKTGKEAGIRRPDLHAHQRRAGANRLPTPGIQKMVRRVVEHNELRRAVEHNPDVEAPPSTRMNVNVRRDHNLAFMQVEEPGSDLRELVQAG